HSRRRAAACAGRVGTACPHAPGRKMPRPVGENGPGQVTPRETRRGEGRRRKRRPLFRCRSQQVYALTLRLRHLWYWYFCLRLSKKTLLTGKFCKPRWWRLRWFVTEGLTMKSKLSAALAVAAADGGLSSRRSN